MMDITTVVVSIGEMARVVAEAEVDPGSEDLAPGNDLDQGVDPDTGNFEHLVIHRSQSLVYV